MYRLLTDQQQGGRIPSWVIARWTEAAQARKMEEVREGSMYRTNIKALCFQEDYEYIENLGRSSRIGNNSRSTAHVP